MHFNLEGLSALFASSLHTMRTYVRTIENVLSTSLTSFPLLFADKDPLTAIRAFTDPVDNWNTNPIYSGAWKVRLYTCWETGEVQIISDERAGVRPSPADALCFRQMFAGQI